MTIDEAIAHAREVAKEKYAEGMLCHANPNDGELDGCIECAKEHEQLAEWLEELKANRIALAKASKALDENTWLGYNKAIDDFSKKLKSDEFQKHNINMVFETSHQLSYSDCIDYFIEYIEEIAEQLKEGGAEQ